VGETLNRWTISQEKDEEEKRGARKSWEGGSGKGRKAHYKKKQGGQTDVG